MKADLVDDAGYRFSSPVYRFSPFTPEYDGDAELSEVPVDVADCALRVLAANQESRQASLKPVLGACPNWGGSWPNVSRY